MNIRLGNNFIISQMFEKSIYVGLTITLFGLAFIGLSLTELLNEVDDLYIQLDADSARFKDQTKEAWIKINDFKTTYRLDSSLLRLKRQMYANYASYVQTVMPPRFVEVPASGKGGSVNNYGGGYGSAPDIPAQFKSYSNYGAPASMPVEVPVSESDDGSVCNCKTTDNKCPKGPPGVRGNKGLPGPDAPDGVDGIPGLDGITSTIQLQPQNDCITCPQGDPGIQGPVGHIGLRGVRGQRGRPGLPGLDSAPGFPGKSGASGMPGDQGPIGLPGLPGTDVEKLIGVRGIPGPIGQCGPDGEIGLAGPSAFAGLAGRPGDRGPPGLPGLAGSDGLPGLSGEAGGPGIDAEYCGYVFICSFN
uniref:Col_cuticle_N domain-containing protein n=1 Tax=Rhabditophanes sp. KR3021 TaxID=114890 RepID=A0AC35TW92_9BILA